MSAVRVQSVSWMYTVDSVGVRSGYVLVPRLWHCGVIAVEMGRACPRGLLTGFVKRGGRGVL